MPRKQYEFKHEPKKRPTWQKWLIGIIAAPIVVIFFLFILGSITGPTEFDDPVVESTSAVESSSDEPSQDELNQQLKDKAIEIDFVTANAGEYEIGTKVKATGEVGLLNDDSIFPTFNLTTESDDGYGLYYVEGFNTSDTEFSNGDIVTIYGTYDGKDEQTGGPKIFVTYIEK